MDFTGRKRELVVSGIYQRYCKFISTYGIIPDDWTLRCLRDKTSFSEYVGVDYTSDDYRILRNMYSSRCHQNKRIRDRISAYLLLGNCYFLTFTLSDDYIDDDFHIHERRIKSLIKSSGITHYVIHQDYGLDDRFTHRLHYHAVVQADHVNQIKQWKYGYYNYKPITVKNSKRLAIYLNKLGNHYIKESNYNKRVIFSREKFL